ncbi:hypothetical protein DIS24_g7372 [Lasiodiplodia hormozganensis]|uniref:Uncharacterized protein n=1 Tax=Lasiodiplodia hormozganensis TaxID=869390 RepID=A0AA39Y8V4_9PEZI|nr:hypothetical protein DIS24_g7372 [Lasiodiplodia hormozganensis]
MPTAASKCYYPDGSVANGLKPCINATNTDSDSHAACCDLSTSVCTTTGYCFADTGYLYRGGCTDKSWDDPSCAAKCQNDNPSGFSNIYQCVAGHWDLDHTSCCGGNTQTTTSCCEEADASFSLLPGTPFGALEAYEAMLSSASSSTSSASATATASTLASTTTVTASATACATSSIAAAGSSFGGGASGATVGAATGASLGALLIASLAVLALRERRWRKRLDKEQQRQQQQQPYVAFGQGYPGGLPKQPYMTSEADGQQLVEAGVNERGVFEMEGNGGGRVRW